MKLYNNKAQIANYILNVGETSKQEIAKNLHLSMPTVLQGVNELLEQNIVIEVGAYQSTGGRKAKAISINPEKCYAVGIDITGSHISFVMIGLQGNLIKHSYLRKKYENTLQYYKELGGTLETFLQPFPVEREKVLGVGISLPGILNSDHTELVRSHALGIENLNLEHIRRFLPYQVCFENDANSALTAEMSGLEKDAVYLSLSNTVGGAVYINGKIFTGDESRSGEFGHMILERNGKRCYCGKRGCLDAYCAAHVLAEYTEDNLQRFFEKLDAGNGQSGLEGVWEEYLDYLAIAVTNLRMCYDCDIIIGGYVGAYMGKYMIDLEKKVTQYNMFENGTAYLRPCRCRKEAAAVGTAMYFVKEYLNHL